MGGCGRYPFNPHPPFLRLEAAELNMINLVKRLRDLQDHYSTSGQLDPENHRIFAEAADEIERLRADLRTIRPYGCVCPTGAEASCQGLQCPRRSYGWKIAQ